MNDIYVTLLSDHFDLRELPADQQAIVRKLFERYKQGPRSTEFSNYYMELCKPVFDGIPRKRIPDTPLYNIAQDLSFRLAIQQGEMRPPDYRDKLEHLILREYNTLSEFCRETGEDRSYIAHLFAKDKNASFERLTRILDKLGYELSFDRKHEMQIV